MGITKISKLNNLRVSLSSSKDMLKYMELAQDRIHKKYNITPIKIFICKSCRYYSTGENINNGWCLEKDDYGYNIRTSLIKCSSFVPLKKSKYKKENKYIKYCLNLTLGLIDSFRINNFYPLIAAVRGEKYELKTKVAESNRGKGASTENLKTIRKSNKSKK